MNSQALIPLNLRITRPRLLTELLAFGAGLALLVLLARVVLYLPFTPVPITGQTFGVALIALSWGSVRGMGIVLAYLGLGGMGLPVLAGGLSGLTLGPTTGYLAGMLIASWVMGTFADKGWTKSFLRTWLVAILGGLITLGCGALTLKILFPAQSAFALGVAPFLVGDFVKNLTAASISWGLRRTAG